MLDLSGVALRAADVQKSLEQVLGQYSSWFSHLTLSWNAIGDEGAGRLAGVLGQCSSLAHLDLSDHGIREEGRALLSAATAGSSRWREGRSQDRPAAEAGGSTCDKQRN